MEYFTSALYSILFHLSILQSLLQIFPSSRVKRFSQFGILQNIRFLKSSRIFLAQKSQAQIKNRLQEAIKKKDPEELMAALKAFDTKIPQNKVTNDDKLMQQKATELVEKSEAQKRISLNSELTFNPRN